MRPKTVLSLAAVLLLAACSLSDDEQNAADALSVALVNNETPDSTRDSVECVADKWVGEVGTDALVKDGLINKDFRARRAAVRGVQQGLTTVSEKTAEGYAAATLACTDYDVVAKDMKEQHPKASDEDIDEYADCLKEIDRDDYRAAITDRWTGATGSAADARIRTAVQRCISQLPS